MGYVKHHAIVVVGHRWSDDPDGTRNNDIRDAHAAAVEAGCIVTPMVDGSINSYTSFMVCPDGSNEGWEHSDLGDAARDVFIAWLRENSKIGDGWFAWSEVVVDPGRRETRVERNAWDEHALRAE